MNERDDAISILKQARDLLAARLTSAVLADSEGILADARGDSYMGEIDGLYEQVGGRLSHVNQMLAQLPAVVETASEPSEPFATDVAPTLTPPLGLPGPSASSVEVVELPGPQLLDAPSATQVHDVSTPPITFQSFAAQAQAGDLVAAAQSLAWLCDLEPQRALRCAAVFSERMAADGAFLLKAMQLRRELESDSFNAALMLLYECFGLVGMESLGVLQTLRLRIRG